MAEKDIYVSLPVDVLKSLLEIVREYPNLASEVKALSRRLDGCYALTSECIQKIGDLSRR